VAVLAPLSPFNIVTSDIRIPSDNELKTIMVRAHDPHALSPLWLVSGMGHAIGLGSGQSTRWWCSLSAGETRSVSYGSQIEEGVVFFGSLGW